MADRVFDFDSRWIRGMKSDSDPGSIPRGYYFEGYNVVNTGGVVACRPGFSCIVTLPEGNLQGATLFRPIVGLPQVVVVINGIIYVADYPFHNFRMLDNVRLSIDAKQVFWAHTEQSAERISTEFDSAIRVIEPKRVLIIQDGGFTAPVWYDGANSNHIRDRSYETPLGGPMLWIGDRLWVAKGPYVYASDIANPLSFREQLYLGSVSAFVFSGEVTAMAPTPSLEYPQLLVFTEENGSILRADVRERNQWINTTDMQREVFKVGASSNRSIVSHYGQVSWISKSGFVQFDSAYLSKQTARLPLRDSELMISKYNLSDDLSLTAGVGFGPYILMSVPFEDNYNQHTWVLNNASIDNLLDESGPSWASIWTGIRPVEWMTGHVVDSERCFCVSKDHDGQNRLWKTFQVAPLDSGCPITWAVMTRGHYGEASGVNKDPGRMVEYRYSDVALTALSEDIDVGIYYAGGLNGAFKQIAKKKIHVLKGSLRHDQTVTLSSKLFKFKAQSRVVRTSDVGATGLETGSCPVERDDQDNRDEHFQIYIVCSGPGTIRWIRSHAMLDSEDLSGSDLACQDETQEGAIRYDGAGFSGETYEEIVAGLGDAPPKYYYESNATFPMEYRGVSAIGVGHATSVISQQAADRAAEIIAKKYAERDISNTLPRILSTGAE